MKYVATVEEACDLVTDGTHYTPKNVGVGVPFLTVKNVTDSELDFSDCSFITEEEYYAAKAGNSAPQRGDVLFSKDGTVGKVHVVKTDEPFAVLSSLAILRPKPDRVDADYLGHTLRSPSVLDDAIKRKTGSAIRRIILSDLKKVRIPLPPLSQQRRIADVLDRAEALRAKRRVVLAELDVLTQAIFLDMFGDPATNPKGWPRTTVGELARKFSDGPFGSNLKSEHYTESGVRVIRLQNIGVGQFIDDDAAYVSEDHFAGLRKHECRPGDVLVGTLGDPNLRACIQPKWLEIALNKADCVQLRPDERVANAEYVCALLNQPATERMAQELMRGQTRVRISMGRLRGLIVPVPPIERQRVFAHRLAALDNIEGTYRSSLSELSTLFATLQQRAFSGGL